MSYYRLACVECQRRKQKCSRDWPCKGCCRRKVPERCSYNESNLPSDNIPQDTTGITKPSFPDTIDSLTKRKVDPKDNLASVDHAMESPTHNRACHFPSTAPVSVKNEPDTDNQALPLVYPMASLAESQGELHRRFGSIGKRSLSIVGHELDASHHPQLTLTCRSFTKPILEVVLERFLDFYGPEMPPAWLPLYWIHDGRLYQLWRVGAAVRSFLRLLDDSFTAVSTTHFGRSIGDWRLVSAGDKIYTSLLRSLQNAICHPRQNKSEEVLMAAVLCVVYEGMRRTEQRAFITHALGVLRLMEFRGAQRHTSGIAHEIFVELRSYWVFAAISTRSPTFLALPEWKTKPWSTGSTSKDILQHLLDHMVNIPTLLQKADQIKDSGVKSPLMAVSCLQQELRSLATDIRQGLYQWKHDWADTYPNGLAEDLQVQPEDDLPVFQYRDPTTGAIFRPPTLVYPNPVLAQAMCHYFAAHILVLSADTRPGNPEHQSIYDFACLMCRSMGYYVRTVPSSLASRVAFPFRVAYDCLPEGGMEREYIEDVFRLIGRRRFSQEWDCALDGISVQK